MSTDFSAIRKAAIIRIAERTNSTPEKVESVIAARAKSFKQKFKENQKRNAKGETV